MWGNWNDIDRIFNTMDLFNTRWNRIFGDYDRFMTRPATFAAPEAGPRTNLYDAGDHLEIIAEVPGINREDLNVKLQGNYLEIRGSRKGDAPEGYTRHRVERGATTFSRSFTLPAEVDATKVEAKLKDGLLTLILPKAEAAKPKQITIH